ncbi:MAG: GTPase HflX [Lachnospiraceae bacterium]|nr:GTPase HflX [Lachnospiraceae bacterium]GFI02989.1 GTPase HflX [Lachnospiraceae bacterium]
MENKKNRTVDESRERVLLVCVDDGTRKEDFDSSIEELKSLAKACYMEPVGVVTQKLEGINKGLYIGTGKVKEVKEAVSLLEAVLVIFDDTLTPSQLRNLQEELGVPILDRTSLILDIFETRARTREAKLQVESAKLKYLLPRLVGMHKALTRQGGTSGSMSSRGAGEKKLELDRRRIEHRISELSRELEEVVKERQVQRKKRLEAREPLVALVGYTNAGKSTIMNGMIELYGMDQEKKVLEKDMLFATLDTTVRHIRTGNNKDFLLSDTVGFLHRLPHSLIKAFHSTLEEVLNADLLLQVVDYSDSLYREQMDTTWQALKELGTGSIPMITVFNKADRLEEPVGYPKIVGEDKIYLSAKEPESLALLTKMILDKIYAEYTLAEFLIPYEKGQIASYFMEHSHMVCQEYGEKGIRITTKCHMADKDKYKIYLIE